MMKRKNDAPLVSRRVRDEEESPHGGHTPVWGLKRGMGWAIAFLLLSSTTSWVAAQDMGIDYVDDNTGVVWFDVTGVSANWSYICLNGCFSGTKNGNRVERTFSGLTLGTTYSINAQIQDNTNGQILPSGSVIFQNGGGGGTNPTCTDGLQNGDETGVDCGGSCAACPTCSDGNQNGDETGVDCGGVGDIHAGSFGHIAEPKPSPHAGNI
ncbi:MAG: family 31 carbohydrate-binding protein, partial [Bacteroidota bacterium]